MRPVNVDILPNKYGTPVIPPVYSCFRLSAQSASSDGFYNPRYPGLKVAVWRSSLEFICLSKLCINHMLILCFSYLVLYNGSLSLSVNHGSGSLFLKFGRKANVLDQRWHNIKIMSNGKVQPMDINVATGTTCLLTYIMTGRL